MQLFAQITSKNTMLEHNNGYTVREPDEMNRYV